MWKAFITITLIALGIDAAYATYIWNESNICRATDNLVSPICNSAAVGTWPAAFAESFVGGLRYVAIGVPLALIIYLIIKRMNHK